jgi:hypothetical protein
MFTMFTSKVRFAIASLGLLTLALVAGTAIAQSGHFVGEQTCTDIGTQVTCSGKVAGLGSTTFTITVTAPATVSVNCRNPAGNVAPGQSFNTTAAGSSGPMQTPRNGQSRYTVTTSDITIPAGSCPNPKWRAEIASATFGNATITLREGGTVSDQVTVPVE